MLYKSKILTLVTIRYSCGTMMSGDIGPKWSFYSCYNYIGLLGTAFMQVMYLGRALRTKETLPDCLEWRQVTRQPLVFRGLTGSQRTPGFGASHSIPSEPPEWRHCRLSTSESSNQPLLAGPSPPLPPDTSAPDGTHPSSTLHNLTDGFVF